MYIATGIPLGLRTPLIVPFLWIQPGSQTCTARDMANSAAIDVSHKWPTCIMTPLPNGHCVTLRRRKQRSQYTVKAKRARREQEKVQEESTWREPTTDIDTLIVMKSPFLDLVKVECFKTELSRHLSTAEDLSPD